MQPIRLWAIFLPLTYNQGWWTLNKLVRAWVLRPRFRGVRGTIVMIEWCKSYAGLQQLARCGGDSSTLWLVRYAMVQLWKKSRLYTFPNLSSTSWAGAVLSFCILFYYVIVCFSCFGWWCWNVSVCLILKLRSKCKWWRNKMGTARQPLMRI